MIAVRLATQKLGFELLDDLAVSVRCRRGDLILGPGHSRQYWFKIVSGAAKRFSIHSDGRRQIVDLLLPGDLVGIGRDADLEFTVEAVTDGTVLARYSRHLPIGPTFGVATGTLSWGIFFIYAFGGDACSLSEEAIARTRSYR